MRWLTRAPQVLGGGAEARGLTWRAVGLRGASEVGRAGWERGRPENPVARLVVRGLGARGLASGSAVGRGLGMVQL